MLERFITALCWILGPLGTFLIICLWVQKDQPKIWVLFLVFLMDLWLVVRYL